MSIRSARPEDVPRLVEMIGDLAEYERARHEVEIDDEMLDAVLFGREPSAFVLVLDIAGELAGFALYFRSFSTWTGHSGIYLEDLYVDPRYRKAGLGRSLLVALAQIAVNQGCRRLEWSVLDWNAQAIAFYRSLGALPLEEWTRFRLAGSALSTLALGRPLTGAAG
jgi:GNAT superfamily N-acetyltransferase